MTEKKKKDKKDKKIHRIENGILIALMVGSVILLILSKQLQQQMQADTAHMGMWVCLLSALFLYCLTPSDSNDDSIGDDSEKR
jgi:hypothetical protein